jgi:D-alanyl-lipoteichoic acid acyltransferase DltB (MBOAT superfamily)
MLFNSVEFAIFLPIVLAVYYLLPHRGQNRFLLLASCLFYAAWDWRFLFPLLFSTIIDYYSASRMETLIIAGAPKSALKKYLILSVVTNLGLLGFFKYLIRKPAWSFWLEGEPNHARHHSARRDIVLYVPGAQLHD